MPWDDAAVMILDADARRELVPPRLCSIYRGAEIPWDDAAVIPAESYRNAQYETVPRRPPSIWSDPILCLCASGALHRQSLLLICSVYAADDLWRRDGGGRLAGYPPTAAAKAVPVSDRCAD